MLFGMDIVCMKLEQYSEYIFSTVGIDDLVLKHRAISSHSAEYASMRVEWFMGFKKV